MQWDTCIDFSSPRACMNCQTMCPFNHANDAVIHPIVRAIAAVIPMFNGFFSEMDRHFGYSKPKSEEEMAAWWNRDVRKWDGATVLGSGKLNW